MVSVGEVRVLSARGHVVGNTVWMQRGENAINSGWGVKVKSRVDCQAFAFGWRVGGVVLAVWCAWLCGSSIGAGWCGHVAAADAGK